MGALSPHIAAVVAAAALFHGVQPLLLGVLADLGKHLEYRRAVREMLRS